MSMRLLVVMDPLASLNPKKDSTLSMLRAAQSLGLEVFYAQQADLWVRDGKPLGRVTPLHVDITATPFYRCGPSQVVALESMQIILMRKDPPFDMEFIYTTYILERAEALGSWVINRPQGLRDMNEKVYTAWFADCCAPTLITRAMADMQAFLDEHGKVVCKPLDGMGGRSIFVLDAHDKNARVVFETLTQYGARYAIVQRYIPDIVTRGDARILLIDGEPVPYALARIPAAHDNRGNLAAGAVGQGRALTERDRLLCQRIGPTLARAGMLFVGLDVIGDYVTEINVTSPTGIRELDQQFGLDIGRDLLQKIVEKYPSRARDSSR
jgi:glutathione synthase